METPHTCLGCTFYKPYYSFSLLESPISIRAPTCAFKIVAVFQ